MADTHSVYDCSFSIFKWRVDIDSSINAQFYLNELDNYMKFKKLNIKEKSAGFHQNSKGKHGSHFHYHVIVSHPLPYYKNATSKNPKQTNNPSDHIKNKDFTDWDISGNFNGGCCFQIEPLKKATLRTQQEVTQRVLRYPLKEGFPYIDNILFNNWKEQMVTAQGEFRLICEQREKDERKKEDDRLKWSQFSKHIKEQGADTYRSVLGVAFHYLRCENPPVKPQLINEKAIQYCFSTGILTENDFIKLYANKTLLDDEDYSITNFKNEVEQIKAAFS